MYCGAMMELLDEMYDQPDAEGDLRFDQFGEAVDIMLDEANALPETVEVTRYVRIGVKPEDYAERILEFALEILDEEYRGDDSPPTVATEDMLRAAYKFMGAMQANYVPWRMDPVETEVVNVREWARANWSREDMHRYIMESECGEYGGKLV